MLRSFLYALLAVLLVATGCSTPKPTTAQNEPPVVTEFRDLDTMTVTPEDNGVIYDEPVVEIPQERPVYREAYRRTHDLLHTKLDVRFDWDRETVIGKASLRLKPIFKASQELTLDAKNFNFKSIKDGNGRDLGYTYEGNKQTVTIDLGREYTREEEYEVVIDYEATPAESGGSAAITSDKGLFFINADGSEDKPQQIWTQGETEHNSRWFPTIDKPNERMTQEVNLTVQDKYVTLSNGTLIRQQNNGDGTRTDYWKQDLGHAPYLVAVIVGEFDVVDDQPWNGIPVNYYMEAKYRDYATDVFPYTREMLTFFSELTGTPYPWAKYSQVAVRDYVSGAMENTTAVIFGEFMNGTDRDLIDVDLNEKIVAHEMFHHWFGDLVTCESWSNLTLNEGFANYSEYLWLEKKYGREKADMHMIEERSGYFQSVQRGDPHELIWYDYDEKEQMFDAHSYNKGGAVLHMLRDYLGDEVFFASLERYLSDNEFTAVEVDELRLAFEDVSGQDLNWFFDQWFLKAGHPKLSIETGYADGQTTVTITQTQDTDNNVPAVFMLPTKINVYANGSDVPTVHEVIINRRTQTFTFAGPEPDLVILDPNHVILAEFDYEKTGSELARQFEVAPTVIDRMLVLQRLSQKASSPEQTQTYTAALNDPYPTIRQYAIQFIEAANSEQNRAIRRIARTDEDGAIRALAIERLAATGDTATANVAALALEARPYPVVAAGLAALAATDPERASTLAGELESVDNDDIKAAVGQLYLTTGNVDKLPFFEENLSRIDGFGAVELFGSYQTLLSQADAARISKGQALMKAVALDQQQSPWRRLGATKALNDLSTGLSGKASDAAIGAIIKAIGEDILTIKAAETEPQLIEIYQQYGG